MLDNKLKEVFADIDRKNEEMEDVKNVLIEARHNVLNLEKENAALLAGQVAEHDLADENGDYAGYTFYRICSWLRLLRQIITC